MCEAIQSYKENQNLNVPIFIKLTSDLTLDGLGQMLEPITQTFDGIILANTTQQREHLNSDKKAARSGKDFETKESFRGLGA